MKGFLKALLPTNTDIFGAGAYAGTKESEKKATSKKSKGCVYVSRECAMFVMSSANFVNLLSCTRCELRMKTSEITAIRRKRERESLSAARLPLSVQALHVLAKSSFDSPDPSYELLTGQRAYLCYNCVVFVCQLVSAST